MARVTHTHTRTHAFDCSEKDRHLVTGHFHSASGRMIQFASRPGIRCDDCLFVHVDSGCGPHYTGHQSEWSRTHSHMQI